MSGPRLHRRAVLAGASAAALTPTGALAGPDVSALYDRLWAERQALADDVSRAGVERKRLHAKGAVIALRAVDTRALTPDARLGHAAIRWAYESEARARERFPHGTVGARFSPWVVSHLTGAWLSPDGPERAERIRAETERIRCDLDSNWRIPAPLVDRALERMRQAPRSPALDEQMGVLEAAREGAPAEPGAWRLPHGEEWYTIAFRDQTGAEIGVDEARRRGRAETAELTAEADKMLRNMNRSIGTVAERLRALSVEPSQLYADTSQGRDQAVADMNAAIAAIRPRLARVVSRLPMAAIAVRRMSPADEARARAGYREAPSFDGAKAGAYFVDLARIGERPRFSLPTVAMHETLPGHLLQMPWQARLNLHPLRAALGSHAYSEGWAVHAEALADELGLYDDDPLGRLGYLQSRLFRTARLLADIGLNRDRWTIAQAARFIADTTGERVEAVTADAERYCVWPGQICSYAVGRWSIADLRAGRPPKDFHDAVLDHGPLPAPVLKRAVDKRGRFTLPFGLKA